MSPTRFASLVVCFAFSGLAALVYQTTFSQELTLALGATQPAVAAVLAATMAGLALGAALAGRFEANVGRPLRLYAWLELGVGLSALCVPAAVGLAGKVQAMLFSGQTEETWPSSLFYLAAALLIVLVPNAFMGATLPLLVRSAVRTRQELGRRVAFLYAVNTLGAAAGAIAGAYVLLPRFGLSGALHVAVAVSLAVFVLALVIDRGSTGADSSEPADSSRELPNGHGSGTWILPAILLSGAVSFLYEVTWTRLLGHVLGGSLYAFGTMLATYLVGLAIGAALAVRWASDFERARRGFIGAELLTGAATLVTFAALDRMPGWLDRLSPGSGETHPLSAFGGAVLMLPGALAIGATFPLAVRILARDHHEVGLCSARVFTWNTVGAILGSLAAAFVLLPTFGFAGTILVAIGANLAIAVWAGGSVRPLSKPALGFGLLLLAGLVMAPPRVPWSVLRHSPLGGSAAGEVVFAAVGRTSTVLAIDAGTDWRLSSDGMPEAAILPPGGRPGRQPTPSWLALLPLAARPRAEEMLVIGLGGGTTLEEIPASVTAIEVVELERQMVEANRFLANLRRRDPLADPRVSVSVNDARSFLRLSDRSFDVIVSQPSHPWTAGASHLFTREFFELARGRLGSDGVLVQWIGLTLVDPETLRSLVGTLRKVFVHVETFCPPPGSAAIFLASDAPLGLDAAAAANAVERLAIWRQLGLRSGEDLLMSRVLDDGPAAFSEGVRLNTDHDNLLETRSPFLVRRPLKQSIEALEEAWRPFDPLPSTSGIDAVFTVTRLLEQGALARAENLALAIADPIEREIAVALVDLARGRRQRGEQALIRLAREQPSNLVPARALVRFWHEAFQSGAAMPPWLGGDPPADAVVEGWKYQRSGRVAEIAELETELAKIDPHDLLFSAATRLRIAWRQVAEDPRRAREAIELLDPLLAERVSGIDLLLRARLGRAAGDSSVVVSSLQELAILPRGQAFDQLRRGALEVLDNPELKAPTGTVEALRRRLSEASRADESTINEPAGVLGMNERDPRN